MKSVVVKRGRGKQDTQRLGKCRRKILESFKVCGSHMSLFCCCCCCKTKSFFFLKMNVTFNILATWVLLLWTTVSDVCNPGVTSWFTYVPTADRHLVASCGSQSQALHYIGGSAEGWAGAVLLWLWHVLPCPFSAFPCPSGQFLRTCIVGNLFCFPSSSLQKLPGLHNSLPPSLLSLSGSCACQPSALTLWYALSHCGGVVLRWSGRLLVCSIKRLFITWCLSVLSCGLIHCLVHARLTLHHHFGSSIYHLPGE